MLYEDMFLISLVFTLAIEVPVLFVLVKYLLKDKEIRTPQLVFAGIVASALTLPYLWFILPAYINAAYYIFAGEFLVTVVEGVVYNRLLRLGIIEALLVSVIANMSSFVLGLVLL